MKRTVFARTAAGFLAACLALGLAGCGAKTESTASSQTAESAPATTETATAETADPYAYLSDFDYSSIFDENGYVAGVTATDYVTVPADLKLTLSEEANTVAAEDVDSYINDNILASFEETVEVTDRAAATGDTVNIDYAGSIDGVAFDGGTAQGYDLTLGSGRFIDGFEDQIVGHTPGETFDVVVTFPDPYENNPDLAGKEAVFTTTLNSIQETQLPELTDAWVQENLNQELGLTSVDTLKSYVEGILLFDQQANEIYSQLNEQLTVAEELPESLVKYFEDYYLLTPFLYSQMSGATLDDFVAASGFENAAAYLESIHGYVESAAHQTLIIQALAETYGIVCDTDTMNSEFMGQFGTNDTSSYTAQYGETYLKMSILNNLVTQHLIEVANA